jgi:hypothetical protein
MITTKFYLDTRSTAAGCAAPLKISVTVNRTVSYIPTGIRLLPSDWNKSGNRAKSAAIQQAADLIRMNVINICLQLSQSGKLDGLNAREVRDRILEEMSPAEHRPERLLETFRIYAAQPKLKPRTKEIYLATVARILAFDPKAERLTFADIDVGWMDRFDSFLAQTSPKKNARNIHHRNIRAVFNYARKRGFTQNYPFLIYEIRNEATKKRALSAEMLRTLFYADLPEWQRKYVDFFFASFFLIGMNTEDLLHATDIVDGRLEYRRAKTAKPYSIKMEPECQAIFRRMAGKSYLLNPLDTYAKTCHWTSKVDNVLKDIAARLGLPRISMYWARHSWITIATDLDIPPKTVEAAAGHSGGSVTDIYIDFDRSKIDFANRVVMDFVLYKKKPMTILDVLRSAQEKKAAGD